MAAGYMAETTAPPGFNDQVNWSFGWTPATAGSVTIKTRAVDDSGNLETPSSGDNCHGKRRRTDDDLAEQFGAGQLPIRARTARLNWA